MRNKLPLILPLSTLLFLMGCSNGNEPKESILPNSSSTTSHTSLEASSDETSEEPIPSSSSSLDSSSSFSSFSISSSEIEKSPIIINNSYFPSSTGSGYPADQEIGVDGVRFYVGSAMKGGGDYDGTVQFRSAAKGSGYFYNLDPIKAKKVVIEEKSKTSDYVDHTAILSLYVGDEAGEKKTSIEGKISEESGKTTVTYELDGESSYFHIINEDDKYAAYMYSATLYL